jgi:lysophospholipase L1-like esterase
MKIPRALTICGTVIAIFLATLAASFAAPSATLPALDGIRRIVFLGDSITYSGQYIDYLDAYLTTRFPDQRWELLDLGLSSETVSGLSEPGHAGGKFPRPDLHERLDRVLAKTKPDLVVACYGMNCGIYHPFSEERFKKYQAGIQRLREKVLASGAKILHVTPPTFDPVPIKAKVLPAGREVYEQPFEGYNQVLDRYSDWLLEQRKQGWDVVSLHHPMNKFLAERRRTEPDYALAKDGVHANATGHWLIAQEILRHWKAPTGRDAGVGGVEIAGLSELINQPQNGELLKFIRQRGRILSDAWLTECRHLRPGMKQGLPVSEAQKQAGDLTVKIRELAGKSR